MKKLFTILAVCLMGTAANAQSGVQSVLNQLLGSDATSSTVTSILENVVGSAVSKLNLSIEGTWTYSQPEVQFKSDNLLAQAGGAAATTKIENTLQKLYGKIGLNESLSYTFNSDNTFTQTMKIGSKVRTFKGTYTLDTQNKIITLQYSSLGMGKISAIYANTGTSLALLFDASKLLNLLKKTFSLVGTVSGSGTLATVTALVQNYEGMLLGYKMKK